MDSFLERIPVELYLVCVVACYNGAKPVVVDTKDLEVVRNIFGDLPMHYAFPAGKTDLFSGLAEAAKIAQPWQPKSTLLLMISDGDTVPATGHAQDAGLDRRRPDRGRRRPRAGSFIDGRMSRQDTSTLRQIAARLGGIYHDGNAKHIGTAPLSQLDRHSPQERVRAAHAPRIRLDRLRPGALCWRSCRCCCTTGEHAGSPGCGARATVWRRRLSGTDSGALVGKEPLTVLQEARLTHGF